MLSSETGCRQTKFKLEVVPREPANSQATTVDPNRTGISQLAVEEFSNMFPIESPTDQPPNTMLTRVVQRLTSFPLASEICPGTRWIAYELEKHIMVLVGPVVMDLEAGAEIALFIPEDYRFVVDQSRNKLVLTIERKIKETGEFIMGYCYFVYEPAHLAYPTLICDWLTCYRRNTLKQYFSSGSNGQNQEGLVYGNIGHSMLEGLGTGLYANSSFEEIINQSYHKSAHELYLVGHEYSTFAEKFQRKFRNLYNWFDQYVRKGTELELIKGQLFCKINKVAGCEVRIRSRVFGFKGIIDMLLDCTLRRGSSKTQSAVPFQLKTGQAERNEHSLQVHIYNLMLCQKFSSDCVGLLYYPATNKLSTIITGPLKIYQVLIRRNNVIRNTKRLSQSDADGLVLPDFDRLGEDCKDRCEYYKECITGWITRKSYSCSTLRDIEDMEEAEDLSILKLERFKSALGHLQQKDKEYLSRWMEMLHLEDKTQKLDLTKATQKRLNILPIANFKQFCEQLKQGSKELTIELESRPLEIDDYVLLDSSFRRCEKVMCHIRMIRFSERVFIETTNHDSKSRCVRMRLKVLSQQVDFNSDMIEYVGLLDCNAELEKVEYGIFSQHRSIIVNLTFSDKKRNKIRRVVMGEHDPTFACSNPIKKHMDYYDCFIKDSQSLNQDQKEAIRKALTMDMFSLIEGMPGTGKTKVIVKLIEIFAELGVKVLVSSYTNNSLELILDRVLGTSIDKSKIIREGSRTGNFPQFYYDRSKFSAPEQVQQYFESKKVWFVTLSSLQQDHIPSDFGIIIIDEASQCLEPLCISALDKARKFILIGDYQQLQPLVRSQEAAQKGMAVSLFQRLCKKYPQLTTPLKKQYRMCEEIMALSNTLVYGGMLEAANSQTGKMRLKPNQQVYATLSTEIQNVIDPRNPIVFINHDGFSPMECPLEQIELTTTLCLFNHLLRLDIPSTSVISFYNHTSYLLNERIKRAGGLIPAESSILTVDKSQGIDKECIIFLVQDGPDQNKLIGDLRRINVSLTRAKCKLIIIGSKQHTEKVLGGKLVELLKPSEVLLTTRFWKEIQTSS